MRGLNEGFKRFKRKIKDVSCELLSDAEVEIHSDRFALISGCRKLTEYSEERITLEMKDMTLTVIGEYLEPQSLINGKMEINGVIKEVRYERD